MVFIILFIKMGSILADPMAPEIPRQETKREELAPANRRKKAHAQTARDTVGDSIVDTSVSLDWFTGNKLQENPPMIFMVRTTGCKFQTTPKFRRW